MGYLIGAGPLDPAVKRYNGGTSSFTMDNSGTTNGTLLWVDGVAQVPGTDYNVSGTTITTLLQQVLVLIMLRAFSCSILD